jgi:hypothetical protein
MIRGVSTAWGLGVGQTTPHHKERNLLQKAIKSIRTWTFTAEFLFK